MRRRFTVPLILIVALLPWYLLRPPPPQTDPDRQPARFSSGTEISLKDIDAGGFSGIEISDDGMTYHLLSDRGLLVTGGVLRSDTGITGLTVKRSRYLKDRFGTVLEFPNNDSEGLAIDAAGRLNISFEHAHRVLRFDTWEALPVWPGYTRSWRAFHQNGGLEALAIDPGGTLFAMNEARAPGASVALVYRKPPDSPWAQPFTLPLDTGFIPVGADFGPDGRLYVLERDLYPFGFRSQVRSMIVTEGGLDDIQTVLQTPLFTHGNLEGIAVWRDPAGNIRLTMVSDDNFLFVLRSEIAEYVIAD